MIKIKKIVVKIGLNWVFLIAVFLLYIGAFIFNTSLFFKSLLHFKEIFLEVIPVLITIFLLTFLANLWLGGKKTNKMLSGKTGVITYISAVFLGILSSGPIYMWYPLLSELKEKGLKNSLITIFLYNRAVKLPLMPMIVHYFGLQFLFVTTFFMIIFSLINGYLVAKFTNKQ